MTRTQTYTLATVATTAIMIVVATIWTINSSTRIPLEMETLPSQLGVWNPTKGSRLVDTGDAGFLSYGPYLKLPQGTYQLDIEYTSETDKNSYDISFFEIPRTISSGNLEASGRAHKIIKFTIDSELENHPVEFRVFYSGQGSLELFGIAYIEEIQPQLVLGSLFLSLIAVAFLVLIFWGILDKKRRTATFFEPSGEENYSRVLRGLICFAFLYRLLLIFSSHNVAWEPDSYLHILFIKSITAHMPESLWYLNDIWAKPVYTAFFGLISYITGSDSLYLFKIINTLLYYVALRYLIRSLDTLRVDPLAKMLGIILYLFAFVVLRSSISELTEPLGLLFFTVAMTWFFEQKHLRATVALSLLPLIRMESAVIVAIFVLAIGLRWYRAKRRYWSFRTLGLIGLSILPLLIWNFIGYSHTGIPWYLIANGYGSVGSGAYGFGSWTHYIKTLANVDLFLLVLFTMALVLKAHGIWKRALKFGLPLLIVTTYVVFLTVLYKFGLFGSAGLSRYLVVIYPVIILEISCSLSYGFSRFKTSNNVWQSLRPILPVILFVAQLSYSHMLITGGKAYGFLYNTPTVNSEVTAVGQYLASHHRNNTLYYGDSAIAYFADRNFYNSKGMSDSDFATAAPGSLFVWDRDWVLGNFRIPVEKFNLGFHEVHDDGFGRHVRLFTKD